MKILTFYISHPILALGHCMSAFEPDGCRADLHAAFG